VKCELLIDVNMCSSLNFIQRPVLVVDAGPTCVAFVSV